jgi:hypothetical protein
MFFSLLDRRGRAAPGSADRGDTIPPLRWVRVRHENEASRDRACTFFVFAVDESKSRIKSQASQRALGILSILHTLRGGEFRLGAVLQHSDTPSLRVTGFEDENEAPGWSGNARTRAPFNLILYDIYCMML